MKNSPKIKTRSKISKRQKRRELLIGLSILAVTVLICLIFLEITIRLLEFDYIPIKFDECTGTKFKPDSTGTLKRTEYSTHSNYNSMGFRDIERSVEKENGKFRILVVGDSYIEAAQVNYEDSFSVALEESLHERGHNVEVISMGVGGWGNDQELQALKCYGLRYNPDLVVMSFLNLNDVKNNYKPLEGFGCKPYYFLNSSGSIEVDNSFLQCNGLKQKAVKLVGQNSRLIYFSYLKAQQIMANKQSEEALPIDFGIYSNKYDENWNAAWGITKRILLESEKISNQAGANFTVMIATAPQQLDWDKTLEKYPQLAEGYSLDKPDRIVLGFCSDARLDCVHLLPRFKQISEMNNASLHFPIDGHWSPEGNHLAAEIMAEHIQDKYLNSQSR